ncbi:MAG: quinolinate phosphoribosyl transferase [Candidatus Binatia bacterium]
MTGRRASVPDVRDEILRGVAGKQVVACIVADDDGLLAESDAAACEARALGLQVRRVRPDGRVRRGDEIVRFAGNAKQIVSAEDVLIGVLAKASGIATAARRFVELAAGRPRIVSGAWKKMPSAQKEAIRRAVHVGGASCRICERPFVYLDKNYIRILGGIAASLAAVTHLTDHEKVVQLKGRYQDIAREATEAVRGGADLLHIDTGRHADAGRVSDALTARGLRHRVRLAFGGNIRLEDIAFLRSFDIDILDIGRQIVDAPLLDMRMEVCAVQGERHAAEELSGDAVVSSPA